MRSLFTQDIKGTKPTRTIFQKSIFTSRYQNFSKSNPKNPQWYVPIQKQQQNSTSQKQYPRFTLKLMSEHTGLSRSIHFQSMRKSNEAAMNQSRLLNNSSILSSSGRNSMSQIKKKQGIDNSPYFPHKYQDYKQTNHKFTGDRTWKYDKPQTLNFAQLTKSQFQKYI